MRDVCTNLTLLLLSSFMVTVVREAKFITKRTDNAYGTLRTAFVSSQTEGKCGCECLILMGVTISHFTCPLPDTTESKALIYVTHNLCCKLTHYFNALLIILKKKKKKKNIYIYI